MLTRPTFIQISFVDARSGCRPLSETVNYYQLITLVNNIYRKDKPDGYGRSLLLIKSDIISEPVDIQTNCDIIFRKIKCSDLQTLIIGSAYRPTNNDIDNATGLVYVIRSICHKYKNALVWLAGDSTSQTSTGQRMLLLDISTGNPSMRLSLLLKVT